MTCKIIFGKKKDGSIDKSIIQEVKAPNGNRSLLFDNIKNNMKTEITSNDKIIWGHPTIGKSYLKHQGEDRFITLDDDYKYEIDDFVDSHRGSETRQEYKGRKPKEYNQFMLNLYDRLKKQAEKEGKMLFVSNTNILKERMSDFDKVINMPKDEFKKRFDARGATYGFEDWKSDIDNTISKIPTNKVINTAGYLSDLLNKDTEALKQYAITYTDEFKQWAQNKPVDSNGEVTYAVFSQYGNFSAVNPVSDEDEQAAEIKNKFRKPNGERPKWTQEFAFKKAKEFNTNSERYPDNKTYRAESIKYIDNKEDNKIYYRVRLTKRSKPLNTFNSSPNILKIGDILSQTYFTDPNVKSRKAVDVLNDIIAADKSLSPLASKLLEYVKYNNININLSEKENKILLNDGTYVNASATYFSNSNSIEMYVNENWPPKKIEQLLLHEILHAITSRQLRGNSEAVRVFRKLFDYAKNNIEGSDNMYQLYDIDEFMVSLFTDSKFISMLSEIPPMSGIKKYNNLFEEIMDFLLGLIGIKKENPTLYNQATSVASNIIEDIKIQAQEQEMFEQYMEEGPEPVDPGYDERENSEIDNSQFKKIENEEEKVNDIINLLKEINFNIHNYDKTLAKSIHNIYPFETLEYIEKGLSNIKKATADKYNDFINRIEMYDGTAEEKLSLVSLLLSEGTDNHEIVKYTLFPEYFEMSEVEQKLFDLPFFNYYSKDNLFKYSTYKNSEGNDINYLSINDNYQSVINDLFDSENIPHVYINYITFDKTIDNVETKVTMPGTVIILDGDLYLVARSFNEKNTKPILTKITYTDLKNEYDLTFSQAINLSKNIFDKISKNQEFSNILSDDILSLIESITNKEIPESITNKKIPISFETKSSFSEFLDSDISKESIIDVNNYSKNKLIERKKIFKKRNIDENNSLSKELINTIKSVVPGDLWNEISRKIGTKLHETLDDLSFDSLKNSILSYFDNHDLLSALGDTFDFTNQIIMSNDNAIENYYSKLRLINDFIKKARSFGLNNALSKYDKFQQQILIDNINYIKNKFKNTIKSEKQFLVLFSNQLTKDYNDNIAKIKINKYYNQSKLRSIKTFLNYLRLNNFDLSVVKDVLGKELDRKKDFLIELSHTAPNIFSQESEIEDLPFKKIDSTEFKNKTNQPQKESYKETLDKLSSRFGIKYSIVNNPSANWVGRYKQDGTIEINEAFIDQYPDAPFHEFFHPFLDVIEKNNSKLFNALKQEIDSLLKSTDPKDVELKRLLNRILNDKDYTNPDGTLNALGYKEAITELVGAHALKAHNDEWRRREKQKDSNWNEKTSGWQAIDGPGMSEVRQKRIDPLMKQLWNYIKNVIDKILRRDDPSSRTGFTSGNLPVLPSELNPNMTLSDLGYLMGQGTSPVKLDLNASRDMPVQYKKFNDNQWINTDAYSGDEYSDSQRKLIENYNKVNENLDDSDKKIEIEVSKLSNKKISQLLSKKLDYVRLYKLRKANEKGRLYVENRTTMKQDLKFLARSKKTKEEFKAQENAPGSVLAREMGTRLHAINESILNRIMELDIPFENIDNTEWANKVFETIFQNDAFYKEYVEEIKKGNTPFSYKEVGSGTSIPVFDEYGNFLYEDSTSRITKDGTRSFDEMIKSMLRLYNEVYKIQNDIDPTKKPLILMEMPLYDEKADEAGTTDFMVFFSDASALIYDHKFINFKYKKVTINDMKKDPQYDGMTEEEMIEYIYAKREKQGYGLDRYKPSKKYPDGNQYFFDIDDSNIDALYRWKQDSYEMQLSRYSDMLRDLYGIKKMRQVRVIPNAVSFDMVTTKNANGEEVVDLEKSKLNFLLTGSGDHSLLSQLPTKSELTEDKFINDFIDNLEKEKNKIRQQLDKKGWDNNPFLTDRFNQISKAITALKVENGLLNIIEIVKNLNNDITKKLEEPKTIKELIKDENGKEVETEIPNPNYINLDDINSFLEELNLYANFLESSINYIDNLKKKGRETEEGANKFKAKLGSVTTVMYALREQLKTETLEILLDINRKEKLMSEQRFLSYTQQSDINSVERYMTHLSNVRHPLVNMFSKMYEKVVYNRMQAEKDLISKIEEKNNALKEWAKNKGITIYKAYEMLLNNDKNLIGKWNSEFYKEFESHRNNEKADVDWYIKNFKRNEEQEIYFQNRKQKTMEWYKKKFGDKWEENFETWLDKNDITYNNGKNSAWLFVQPARDVEPINQEQYYNNQYKTILANKPLKDFYDFYRKQNIELSKMVDFKIGSNFVAEIRKDTIDSIMQNGLSGTKIAKDFYKSIFNSWKYDENRDIMNVDDEPTIPIMFTDSVNVKDKSIDLAKSMIIFSSHVHQYKGVKELESMAKSLRSLIANTNLVKTDLKGNKIRIEGSSQFQTIQKENKNILALFDDMIKHYIYGQDINQSGMDPQITKIISKVVELNSKKNIAMNFLSATAGHIGSMAQMNKLAKESKLYTSEHLRKARDLTSRFNAKAVFAYEFFMIETENLTKERAGHLNKNALRNKYTKGGVYILQRNSEDVLNQTILLAMMYNYSIDPVTGKAERIEFLQDKYKDHPEYGIKDYKWPTMHEMIELTDEEGKMINPHTGKEFGFDEFNSFRKKVLEVAKKTRGSASEEDIAAYKTTLIGKVLMQFKSWMPAMLRERVKKQQYDVAMEEFEVGSWNAMWQVMKAGKANAFGQLMLNIAPFIGSKFAFAENSPVFQELYENWKQNYPEDFAEMMDKYGLDPNDENDILKADELVKKEFIKEYVGKVKGTAKEFQMYLMLMMMMLMIWWSVGDDEEKRNPIVKKTIAVLERAMLEVGFFLPVFDYFSTQAIMGKGQFEMGKMISKSPVPAFGVVTDAYKLLVNTGSEAIDLISGISPFENKYMDIFNIGDEPMANPFNPKIKKDTAPIFKYTVQFLPTGKGITDFLGIFETTDKKDTIWDWLASGSDYAK